MVVRFVQFIPTGQAVETTEVVSQLDPRFRKVWPGMAGNRFWSVRLSRILVVRFDSDQGQGDGARGRAVDPRGAPGARPRGGKHRRAGAGQPWRRRRAAPPSARSQIGAHNVRRRRMASRAAGADYPLWKQNLILSG